LNTIKKVVFKTRKGSKIINIFNPNAAWNSVTPKFLNVKQTNYLLKLNNINHYSFNMTSKMQFYSIEKVEQQLTLKKYIGYAQSNTLPMKNKSGPFVLPDWPNTRVLNK